MEDVVLGVLNSVYGTQRPQHPAKKVHQDFAKKINSLRIKELDFLQLLSGKATPTTNLERINQVSKVLGSDDIRFNSNVILRYQKSSEVSKALRDRATAWYKQRHFAKAHIGYSQSLLFAPPDSPAKDVALAFSNRSAVFYETKKYASCLLDISRALAAEYPPQSLPKLLERESKCCRHLRLDPGKTHWKDMQFLERLIHKTESCGSEEAKLRKEFCAENIFRLLSPSPYVPTAEDFISIKVSPERGRHVITTRRVSPGTVLILDEPFTKILLNELKWSPDRCHHCHSLAPSGIPCPSCSFSFYCNEGCLLAAKRGYHQYECPCTPYLYEVANLRIFLLALRIVTTLGPQGIMELYDNGDTPSSSSHPGLSNHPSILGSEDGIYRSDSYNSIYHLISHPEKTDPRELLSYAITSLTIVRILDQHSSFFENIREPKVKSFVASLLLLHMQNLPCNAHSLYGLNKGEEDEENSHWIRTATAQEYGAGAFGLLSLINHSCDPNVFRVNQSNGQTAVIALKPLSPGEELLDNYGHHYALAGLEERRLGLLENYYFECGCLPCRYPGRWPVLSELKSIPERLICSDCAGREEILKMSGNESLVCPHCATKFSRVKCNEELDMEIDAFFIAHEQLLSNDPLDAIPVLENCLTYFTAHVQVPFIRINDTEETYKQALYLIANS